MLDNRQLYEYGKDVHNAEIERFKHLEDKADRYLTGFGFLLAAAGVMIGLVFDHFVPPHGYLQSLLIAIVLIIALGLMVSGLFVFRAVKPEGLAVPPLTDAVIAKLKGAATDTAMNEALVTTLSQSVAHNRAIGETKATALKRSYWSIVITTCLLGVFGLVYFIQKWHAG